MRRIRVLLADRCAGFRAKLRELLESQPDMGVVGEAADETTAFCLARVIQADVLTLDLRLSRDERIEMLERFRRAYPSTRILALTAQDDLAGLRAVLAAGVHGCVLRAIAPTELPTAIRAVFQGRTFIDVDVTDRQPADVGSGFPP